MVALYDNDKSLADSGICKLNITEEEIEIEKKNVIKALAKAYPDCLVAVEKQISYFYIDLEKKLPFVYILTSYSVTEKENMLFADMHVVELGKHV